MKLILRKAIDMLDLCQYLLSRLSGQRNSHVSQPRREIFLLIVSPDLTDEAVSLVYISDYSLLTNMTQHGSEYNNQNDLKY